MSKTVVPQELTTGWPTRAGWRDVTRYQWLVLFVAYLGWMFDSMDSTLYVLVLSPALRDLLGRGATGGDVAQYGGLILSLFLIGWALGGVLFGILADRLGRTRTLIYTILIYAIFTGLAAVSQTWWQLGLFRFFTALGVGGEWAAGAALVAETWPERLRVWGECVLHSAWATGFFAAAVANYFVGGYGWRWVFVLGILPAFLVLWIRRRVREPEMWARVRETQPVRPRLRELFSPELRRRSATAATMAFVAVFGLWGVTYWTPVLIREVLAGRTEQQLSHAVSVAAMALNAGALVGYLGVAPITLHLGRRLTFFLMFFGGLVMALVIYLGGWGYGGLLWLFPLLGFFTNGVFSGFAVYLPELYPTRLRTTGAGFCFNVGRSLASAGPFLTGTLTATLGSFRHAAAMASLIYVVGMAVLPFSVETHRQRLQE